MTTTVESRDSAKACAGDEARAWRHERGSVVCVEWSGTVKACAMGVGRRAGGGAGSDWRHCVGRGPMGLPPDFSDSGCQSVSLGVG